MRTEPFFKDLVIGCFIAAIVIFSSLYIIDPLGLNFLIKIPYINTIKPKASSVARKLKPFHLLSAQPKTIVFGNSRAAYGVDPDMIQGVDTPFYNMGIEFCQPYEMLELFKHSIKYSPVKKAIFFVDYATFSGDEIEEKIDPKTWENTLENKINAYSLAYFSDNAIKSIFETVLSNMLAEYSSKGTKENGHIFVKQNEKYDNFSVEKKRKYAQGGGEIVLDPEKGLLSVEKIQSLCNKHKIECLYVIPPWPKMQVEARFEEPFLSPFNEWKAKLNKIGEVHDFYNKKYKFPDEGFIDQVHFGTTIGNEIIDQVLSGSNALLRTD